jgi:predicted PurR-regulated permease PerM
MNAQDQNESKIKKIWEIHGGQMNPASLPSGAPASSPRWSDITKLIVAIVVLAVAGWLLGRFQNLLGMLLFAFIISYLLHPAARWFYAKTHIPWRVGVTIVFVLFVLVFAGLLAGSGLAVAQQVQNLVTFLTTTINNLPGILQKFAATPLVIGPFQFDLSGLNVGNLTNQLIGAIQPLLGQVGSLVSTVATGAVNVFTFLGFGTLIAYFVVAEAGDKPVVEVHSPLPEYEADVQRMSQELGHIWNSFLRGQLLIILVTVPVYMTLLGGMGVHYFYALAFLAGLARLVPWVGPFVAWTTYALVAIFQGANPFGLSPIIFALIVVGVSLIVDGFLDNFIVPRVMANTLKVHPAAVLFAVLAGGALFGIMGVLLAAPVLATFQLISTYIYRKLFDLDPWTGIRTYPQPQPAPTVEEVQSRLARLRDRLARGVTNLRRDRSSKPPVRDGPSMAVAPEDPEPPKETYEPVEEGGAAQHRDQPGPVRRRH